MNLFDTRILQNISGMGWIENRQKQLTMEKNYQNFKTWKMSFLTRVEYFEVFSKCRSFKDYGYFSSYTTVDIYLQYCFTSNFRFNWRVDDIYLVIRRKKNVKTCKLEINYMRTNHFLHVKWLLFINLSLFSPFRMPFVNPVQCNRKKSLFGKQSAIPDAVQIPPKPNSILGTGCSVRLHFDSWMLDDWEYDSGSSTRRTRVFLRE